MKFVDRLPHTLSRAELDAIMLDKLRSLTAEANEKSPFYQRKFREAQINPEDMKSLADIDRLPITTKQDFAFSQEADPPLGEHITVGLREICRICVGTGARGPVNEVFTRGDIEYFNELMGYNMRLCGVSEEDCAVVTSNYSYVPGGLLYQGALESIGCATIPVGVGDSRRLVSTLKDLPVSVLNTFTTYAIKIAEEALELGIDPTKDWIVRKLLISGEPGGGVPAVRKRLRELYGEKVLIRESYGTAENGRIGVECSQENGFHILEPYQYIEIVDKETNQPVPEGVPGVLVCTSLGRRGWPVIRFRTEDLCCAVAEPCSCGWPFKRISKLMGKANNIYRVKGILLYPEQMAETIGKFTELGLFQAEIIRENHKQDELLIRIEAPEDFDHQRQRELRESLKTALTITPMLEFLPPGNFKPDVKFNRVIDKRQVYSSDVVPGK